MATETPANLRDAFARHRTRSGFAREIERLYERAGASRWQLSLDEFAAALERSVAQRFRDVLSAPDAREIVAYLDGLHLEDLALAAACSAGKEPAWEHFISQFRAVLYAAARAIAGQSAAHELADSMYAELYGLEEREAGGELRRRSLFDYFHGRSKLSTWLRAVLAQRHVDSLRAAKRFESLDTAESQVESRAEIRSASMHAMPDPDRDRFLAALQAALMEALGALEPRDRLRLACYYVDDLTLAEIGRMLGEHEATVSRKLQRALQRLRKQVEQSLRERTRLSPAQVALCFEYATQEWPYDLSGALSRRE